MMFQDFTLFPHLNVRDNISFGLTQISKKERIKRIDELLTLVDLRGSEKFFPHELSGGEQQRIALARSLANKPSIMLLDEATSALDNESEKIVQAALDVIKRSGSLTIIQIAHRLTTIRDSDLIAIVNKGKIAEQGTHAELMAMHGIYAGLVHDAAS